MDEAERLEPGTVEEWSDWLRAHPAYLRLINEAVRLHREEVDA